MLKRFKSVFLTLLPFFFAAFHSTAFSAVYFVATNGNDSNPGTEANPWLTVRKAAHTMQPGDTVMIRQGVYREKIAPAASGTERSYITYRNYGNEEVIVDAQNGTRDACISVTGRSYLQFVGLTLTGASNAAFYATDNSDYLIVDGLKCRNSKYGIRLYGNANPVSHAVIRNCSVYGNSIHGIFLYKKVYDSTVGPGNHVYSNTGTDSYGIEISTDFPGDPVNGARNIIVHDNEVHNNSVQGIRTWNAVGVWIRNNYVHHNGATGIQIENGSKNIVVDNNRCEYNAQTHEYETGIWIDDSVNVAARGNISKGNLIGVTITASNRVLLAHNIIAENNRGVPNLYSARGVNVKSGSLDVTIVHNTVYRNGAFASTKGGVSLCEQSRAVFKNNIVSETAAPYDLWIEQDYAADNNDYFNRRPLVVEWKGSRLSWSGYVTASGQDAHSTVADPLLMAPSASDYRLSAGSPCIDQGGWLTRTRSAGSGRVLAVGDARYFSDGFGVAWGDLIKVGNNAGVRITGIDYVTNVLTMDRDIVWGAGDSVSYPYSGQAPDTGAVEYGLELDLPAGLKVVSP